MNNDANQIAKNLIQDHGFNGALQTVRSGIDAAHANGDNFSLSVWREIRRILEDKPSTADYQEELAV
jgi:hypothetical protein